MKYKTVLVPLTMPLVLAACLGGGGGSGGSGWRNFTSFENINPNQRVQFQSGGGSVNYAADVVEGNVSRDGDITTQDARLRIRFGPDISEDPELVEFEIESLELTVNLPDGSVARTFDGESIADVGGGLAADRFIVLEIESEPVGEDPAVVTDRFYVEDGEELEYMTFGLWELGIGDESMNIGGAAFGALTRVSGTESMPTVGGATYEGDLIGYNVLAGSTTVYVADSRLVADFGELEVTFSSSGTRNLATGVENPGFNLVETTGAINGNTFSGSGLTIAGLAGQAGNEDSGSFGGAFFGPEAAEAGGWFEMRNIGLGDNLNDRYFGSFGGARGEIAEP